MQIQQKLMLGAWFFEPPLYLSSVPISQWLAFSIHNSYACTLKHITAQTQWYRHCTGSTANVHKFICNGQ